MARSENSVKKYVVRLNGEERERLEMLIRKGKSPARWLLKARILLKADVSEAGEGWSDNRIIRALEYCGNPEHHEYELYLAVEDIDHTRTKTKSPQTNGICERFHKTVLNEFYGLAFRKKVIGSMEQLKANFIVCFADYIKTGALQGTC